MKLKLMILFILDTIVLVLLTYLLLTHIEEQDGIFQVICLLLGVFLSITAFLVLYFKFLKIPIEEKKPKK